MARTKKIQTPFRIAPAWCFSARDRETHVSAGQAFKTAQEAVAVATGMNEARARDAGLVERSYWLVWQDNGRGGFGLYEGM